MIMKHLLTLLFVFLTACSTVRTQVRNDDHLLVTSYNTSYGQISCIRGLCCFPYEHRDAVKGGTHSMICVDEALTKELNLAELKVFFKVYFP